MAGVSVTKRAQGAAPQSAAMVQTWGEDPVGATKMESILTRFGADMAGVTGPTPAGWGIAGSMEATDFRLWASPQAFTGLGGVVALATLQDGAVAPIEYPWTADLAGVTLPGPNGV